jgi:hypothetical protein
MFNNSKQPKSLTKYNLFRGITDFGNLEQFDIYESGHSFLTVLAIPTFLEKLGSKDAAYKAIIDNAVHIMQNEFKGMDGIEDISSETLEINDGLNTLNLINKVKEQSASTISMRYTEKSGAPLTKFNQLFLTGLYDPRSSFKHYHGLIEDGIIDAGFENEIFTLIYWVTDSTGLDVEKAFLILAAQPTKAELNIYNSERGAHDAKEVTMEMSCFVVQGDAVNAMAKDLIGSMSIVKNADKFIYTGTTVSK